MFQPVIHTQSSPNQTFWFFSNRRTSSILSLSCLLGVSLAALTGCKKEAPTNQSSTTSEESATMENSESAAALNPEKIGGTPKIFATVNGVPISDASVDTFIKHDPQLSQMIAQGQIPQEEQASIRTQIVSMLIDREVLLQAAAKEKIVTEAEMEEGMKSYLAMYGGEKNLEHVVANAGVSIDEFKRGIKEDFTVRTFLKKKVGDKAAVSNAEVKSEFEGNKAQYREPPTVRARHILVAVKTPADDAAAKEKIDGLYKKVSSGEGFDAVARASSDCPSKAQGGDLGFFSKEMMVKEFSDQAFSMKPGDISKPVKTQFGYHIIKLEETKAGKEADFASAKPQIEQRMRAEKERSLVEPMLKELRDKGNVVMSPPAA